MITPTEEGVTKTSILLKKDCPYGKPVARSQAREIIRRLEEFSYVEFDCSDIEFMRQGFADEIFRVFQNRHPEVELQIVNANDSVAGMVSHVRKRKL